MRIFTFLVLMFSLAGMTAFADSISEREGWQVIPTSKNYSDLVEDLKTAVKAEKMLLVTQASASAGAKGRGITIPGNRIIGVYRNDYALRMLDASVAAGIEAPEFYRGDEARGLGRARPLGVAAERRPVLGTRQGRICERDTGQPGRNRG